MEQLEQLAQLGWTRSHCNPLLGLPWVVHSAILEPVCCLFPHALWGSRMWVRDKIVSEHCSILRWLRLNRQEVVYGTPRLGTFEQSWNILVERIANGQVTWPPGL